MFPLTTLSNDTWYQFGPLISAKIDAVVLTRHCPQQSSKCYIKCRVYCHYSNVLEFISFVRTSAHLISTLGNFCSTRYSNKCMPKWVGYRVISLSLWCFLKNPRKGERNEGICYYCRTMRYIHRTGYVF